MIRVPLTIRLATLGAAALAVALALPGTALAGDPAAPAPGSIQGVVGQAVQQASQTVQDAGAAASAAQSGPVNVAIQIVVSSPGASPVIVQTNANSADAKAGNASSTAQGSEAAQPAAKEGGGGSGVGVGGSAQGVLQASQTAQAAQAQAKAGQTKPVNVAIQIVKDSPGAQPVIVQTNANQGGAQAANAASTAQDAATATSGPGTGGGSGAGSGTPQPPGGALSPAPSPGALAGPSAPADLGIDLGALLGGLPGLDWLWGTLAADLPGLRVELPFPLPGWPSPGAGDQPARDRRDRIASQGPRDRAALPAADRESGGLGGLFRPAAAFDQVSASSSFVQNPARTRNDASAPPLRLPAPVLPAPVGGGGGQAPSGLLLAALAIPTLWLISLGLLVGRLGLASARWRHQAYLAPLQRPG